MGDYQHPKDRARVKRLNREMRMFNKSYMNSIGGEEMYEALQKLNKARRLPVPLSGLMPVEEKEFRALDRELRVLEIAIVRYRELREENQDRIDARKKLARKGG